MVTEKITSLVMEDGTCLPLKKRTAAVIAEVYNLQEKIEAGTKGQLEISIDFKNGSLATAVREMGEPRRIE